jgi:putative GTP pyrophosphokinase
MSQNNSFPSLPPEQLAHLLTGDGVMDALYDRAKNMMWSMVQYKEMQMLYSCALKEIQTKFEILDTEFKLEYNRDPIASVSTRLKRTESVMDKLERKGLPFTLAAIEEHIHDMAGIRVICSYIDDIYLIAEALLRQDDITLVAKKDYIEHPKDNGYRSLHLIVEVPVFLTNHKKLMKVEVQIRTIAMDFWASLEHKIRYKQNLPEEMAEALYDELLECAILSTDLDKRMQNIRNQLDHVRGDTASHISGSL